MAKIVREKIIGFEIVYNDEEKRFDLHSIMEPDVPPKSTRASIYVPIDVPAYEVYWLMINDMMHVGTELDAEPGDYGPDD
jgi:hypothetical protein